MFKLRQPSGSSWELDFQWKKAVVFLAVAIGASGLVLLMILGLTKLASIWL